MEHIEIWKTLSIASESKVLRIGCLLLLFEVATLAAGIGVWMICHGFWLFGSRLVIYWKPARSWFANIIKIPDKRSIQTPPVTWYRWIYLILYFSLGLVFVFFGTKMFVQNGFLEQNIIYWFIRDATITK